MNIASSYTSGGWHLNESAPHGAEFVKQFRQAGSHNLARRKVSVTNEVQVRYNTRYNNIVACHTDGRLKVHKAASHCSEMSACYCEARRVGVRTSQAPHQFMYTVLHLVHATAAHVFHRVIYRALSILLVPSSCVWI